MAKSRKNPAISQKNDSTSINSRRGMSKRAKRNASKKERKLAKDTALVYDGVAAWCGVCGTPHEIVRPGKTQPTCMCHMICDDCGGRIAHFALGEDAKYPTMCGDWCAKCGPFGAIYNEK